MMMLMSNSNLNPAPSTLITPIGETNADLRHPLTVLVCLLPLALVAELYRYLARKESILLADEALQELGLIIGAEGPLLTVLFLSIGCIGTLLVRKMAWNWPSAHTLLRVLGWSAVWALVRVAIGFTSSAAMMDSTLAELPDPISHEAGQELSLLGHLGLAATGAIQEELIFRALLLGGGAALLTLLGIRFTIAQAWLLLPTALIFALAHTDIINHYASAQAFTPAIFIQHSLAGLLYGIIFIRQGLAVSTLSHSFYNALLAIGLLDW